MGKYRERGLAEDVITSTFGLIVPVSPEAFNSSFYFRASHVEFSDAYTFYTTTRL